MIKKIFYTAVFIISCATLINAQICTPSLLYTTSGVHPDTIINLNKAYATIPYKDTLTVIIPTDTAIGGFPAHIDSMSVVIDSLPSGFTYTPDKAHWKGGTYGCILISGTATHTQANTHNGLYKIIITPHAWGYVTIGSPIPANDVPFDPVKGYKLKIRDTSLSVTNISMPKFEVYQNIPNPFSLKTAIYFSSPNAERCRLTVHNVIGDIVYTQSFNAIAGENKIEFSAADLPSGLYIYKLSNKTQTITKRMIVAGK